ncbi:hypothetical protein D3C79_447720 [compost metagenome]
MAGLPPIARRSRHRRPAPAPRSPPRPAPDAPSGSPGRKSEVCRHRRPAPHFHPPAAWRENARPRHARCAHDKRPTAYQCQSVAADGSNDGCLRRRSAPRPPAPSAPGRSCRRGCRWGLRPHTASPRWISKPLPHQSLRTPVVRIKGAIVARAPATGRKELRRRPMAGLL